MTGHRVLHDIYKAPFLVPDPGDAGTVNCDRYGQVVSMTSAAAETRTLSAPSKAGLLIHFALDVDGGTVTLTVTGGYDTAGNTTLAFADAGDFASFTSILVAGSPVWRLENPATTTQVAHIADPAAAAAMTFAAGAIDTGTDMTAAQAAQIVADLAALRTAIVANNAAIDSILVALETAGITAAA